MQVYQSPSASKAGSEEEQYNVALAFLTSGFSSCLPDRIETALTLLEELDNKLEPTTGRCKHPLGGVTLLHSQPCTRSITELLLSPFSPLEPGFDTD